MASRQHSKPGRWTPPPEGGPPYSVGWKVAKWLEFQVKSQASPDNPTALGKAIGCDNRTVEGWIKSNNRPRADLLAKLARAMGVSTDWLTSESSGWPPPDDYLQRLQAILATSSPTEQRAIVEALSDEKLRRALVAYGASLPQSAPPASGARAPR